MQLAAAHKARAAAVDGSRSNDRNVLGPAGGDESDGSRVPGATRKNFLLPGQLVVPDVRTSFENGPGADFECNVAPELHGAGHEDTGGDDHDPAARFPGRVNRAGERLGVQRLTVADRSVRGDVVGSVWLRV